jgi:S1-C subfamily serine protease
MSRWQWLAMAGSLAVVAPLAAQVRIEQDAPSGPQRNRIEMVITRRARLGVKVNLQARESDSIGAYVEAVTPGGPAEKAGIQSGDVITKLDGKSLVGGGGDAEEGRSLPGTKLIELASRLAPNDTVDVQYRRGKDTKTAKLVTQGDDDMFSRMGPEARAFAFDFNDQMGPQMERMHRQLDRMRVEGMPGGAMRVWVGGPLADLELAPLNPDLGQYFGASEGVLVIDVPKDSPLGLKGGDVLLTIDGRKAASPGQAHRILQSYDGDEAVKFEVLRNRKKTTVAGKLPKATDYLRTPGPQQWKTPAPKGEKTWFEFGGPDGVEVFEVRET